MNFIKIEEEIERDEGLVLKPYLCSAGKLTIGVGRNIEDIGISEDEARYLLRNDIHNCIGDLLTIDDIDYYNLSPVRQRVLVNMRFNLGPSRFRQFKKMIAAIKRKDFDAAADEMMDSRWAVQVGNRAKRLEEMMREG
jgi:lysozyme